MNAVDETRQQAMTLRQQGQYDEAIALYATLWKDHRASCTEWDGWGYAYCLRKAHRPEEALDVCREVYKMKADFEQLRNLYGWCIYDLEIANRDDSEIGQNATQFFKAVSAILGLVEQDQFSPCVRTVFRVIDYYKKSRTSYPANEILEWTDRLELDQLSREVGHGTNRRGKPIEYASDREKWYAERCKALFELGRFQECLALSQQALADIAKFHFDNDIWIRWRMALSKGRLGEQEDAICDLKDILCSKRDWFIQRDVARLLYEIEHFDEALKYAVEAALNSGDLEYKWELFLLMGSILEALSKTDEAKKHVLLAAKLRQEHEWRFPQDLQAAIGRLNVDIDTDTSSVELHEKLKSYWNSLKLANLPRVTGEVKNLMGHGRSGFIRGDDGNDYYFKLGSFQGPKDRVVSGLRVVFFVEENPRPDQCDNAVFVEEISA